MKAIDTNVLVRLIARDDPEQLRLATGIMSTGDVLVLPTVVMEAEWVLRSRYRAGRAEITRGLVTALGQDGVTVASESAVAAALAAYAEAGDFADLLHFALASDLGATAFVSFDRSLFRPDEAGPDLHIL